MSTDVTDWSIRFEDDRVSVRFELSSGNFQEISLTAEKALLVSWVLVRFGAEVLKKISEVKSTT